MQRAAFRLSAVLFAVVFSPAFAQEAKLPAFEVAAIKPASPDTQGGGYRFEPGGRTVVTNFTLKNLIQVAWHIQDFQIAGGASWVSSTRYNVEAKAEGNPSEDESRLMLRSLLTDRFHLELHQETRDLPIYALVPAKSGGGFGPGLVRTNEGSCTPAPDFAPAPEVGKPPNCGFKQRLRRQENSPPLVQLQGLGVPISLLGVVLGTELHRTVVDETGLGGNFDMTIEYAPDSHILERVMPEAQSLESTGPSLFTALQEQLGLKLESRRGPVEVFVIVHAERPSEN